MIDVRGVSLSFGGDEHALSNVSFEVERGEFVSLVGPSGCGKSSLLRIIAGVLSPQAGEVLLDGSLVSAGRPAKVGFVPQDGLLLPWRKVAANVELPFELAGLNEREGARLAGRLLELVGMSWAADKYPSQLSGGERQRVAVARALAGDPPVLLLDEPFASLDALAREELNLMLQDIWLRTGAAVVLVTHSISEAVFLSDKVLVLGERPGKMLGGIEVKLPRPRGLDLLADPKLSSLAGRVRELLSMGGGRRADRAS